MLGRAYADRRPTAALRPADTKPLIDAWLSDLARHAREGLPAGHGLMLALVDPPAGRELWRASAIALAGDYPQPIRDRLEHEARSGWPGAGNDAVTLGCARALEVTCIGAAELGSRGGASAPHRAFRERLGLGAFERAVAPIPDGGGGVVLLQVDVVRAEATLGPDARPALGAIAQGLASAYSARFLTIGLARERLLARLSSRQRDVVPYLVEGMSEPAIARTLGRSVHTVHDHTKRIYRKLGVRSRLGLRDLWLGHGRIGAGPATR